MRSFSARGANFVLLAGAVVCFGLVAVAALLQHVFDMQPCSWCVLQRLIFLLVGFVCLIGAVLPAGPRARGVFATLATLLAGSGVVAALYQQFVASKSASCAMTLADRIVMAFSLHEIAPSLFMPTAPCNEANVALLGVPFAVWSAAAFALLVVAGAASTRALFLSRTGRP